MSSSPFNSFICPLDGQPLVQAGGSWRCMSGHCYDIAREGYVNLLPVQNKKSRDPGDSKEMVVARRRFLQDGHYQPIAAATAAAVLAGLTSDTAAILDAGCGEGYYLRQLISEASGVALQVVGLDISKWAVQAAARRSTDMSWVVGSNAKLPLPDASVDRILCMFGFPVHAEFTRVLKPGGRLIQVEAGPDHLRELREIIYPTLKPRSSQRAVPEGFTAGDSVSVRRQMVLDSAALIADLLAMTPHLYRADAEGRARAAALTSLVATIDAVIISYDRTS